MKAIITKAVRPPQPFLTVTPLGLVLTSGNTVSENMLRKLEFSHFLELSTCQLLKTQLNSPICDM